jgi:hypothetical protein
MASLDHDVIVICCLFEAGQDHLVVHRYLPDGMIHKNRSIMKQVLVRLGSAPSEFLQFHLFIRYRSFGNCSTMKQVLVRLGTAPSGFLQFHLLSDIDRLVGFPSLSIKPKLAKPSPRISNPDAILFNTLGSFDSVLVSNSSFVPII